MAGLTDQQLSMSRIDAMSAPVVEVLTLLVVCRGRAMGDAPGSATRMN